METLCVCMYVCMCVTNFLFDSGVSRNPQERKKRRQPPLSASSNKDVLKMQFRCSWSLE